MPETSIIGKASASRSRQGQTYAMLRLQSYPFNACDLSPRPGSLIARGPDMMGSKIIIKIFSQKYLWSRLDQSRIFAWEGVSVGASGQLILKFLALVFGENYFSE